MMLNDQHESGYQTQQVLHARKPLALHEFLEGLRKDFSTGVTRNVACFLFQEEVVVHTVRTIIGPTVGADVSTALDFLRDYCGIECNHIEDRDATTELSIRATVFCVPLPDIQAVLLHKIWQQEMHWRHSPPDTIPFNGHEIAHLRVRVRNHLAAFEPYLLTEQEALPLLLPPGPYATYLGPVVVRWNNTSCHSICPFCNEDFKPAWGLWAFLYDLGGFPICFGCWCKGGHIAPLADADTVSAQKDHRHVFEPDDTAGHSGYCSICGAHWTRQEGWWRQNAIGTWCREGGAIKQ